MNLDEFYKMYNHLREVDKKVDTTRLLPPASMDQHADMFTRVNEDGTATLMIITSDGRTMPLEDWWDGEWV